MPDTTLTDHVYKTLGDIELQIHVYRPSAPAESPRPGVVFFFGGGWQGGAPDQFRPQCRHLAARGMVAATAEYRIKGLHGTAPDACVEDGKSAVRWLRAHAADFDLDPDRLAAGGGSAGGHVAAATALCPGFETPGEDHSISSRPDALALFNPVADNGPDGYGHDRVAPWFPAISPRHNIAAGAPPTLFMLGTQDYLIPVASARDYQAAMQAVGSRCDLVLYDGQPHGFFNHRLAEDGTLNPWFVLTVAEMDRFFTSLGYLT